MKLTNEFTVAVPLERAWETLLDIERVAGFLPGAQIEPGADDEGVYRGSMKVKVGPMVVNYQGTARLVKADEQEHVADIAVQARDIKGQGTASATIRNRLVREGDATRVIAETDLSITGRQAQFGRGIMQDVASRMLDDFARRFESYLLEGDAAPGEAKNGSSPDGADASSRAQAPSPMAEAAETAPLDLGSVVMKTPAARRGLAAIAALVVVALLLRRRRA